jgi:hypothetical protein
MPAQRTAKRKATGATKKGKGKAKAALVEDEAPQEDTSMEVDEEHATAEAETTHGIIEQVTSVAKNLVETVTGSNEEEDAADPKEPRLVTKVVEAAGEFMDQMSGMEAEAESTEKDEKTMTMEKRKAKLDQLRNRLVSTLLMHQYFTI